MKFEGAIGKNLKDISIDHIYVGMKVLERRSYDTMHEVVFIQKRDPYYNQIVLRTGINYLTIIQHYGRGIQANLEECFFYVESATSILKNEGLCERK